MSLTVRPYNNLNDLEAMQTVLVEGRRKAGQAYYVHPGDLSWWLFYTETDLQPEHICLWENDSRLAGWSLLSASGRTFDVFVRPELHGRSLEAKVLLWTEETQAARLKRSQGKDLSIMWVSEKDAERRHWLEMRGFHPNRDGMLVMHRSINEDLPEVRLPDGFSVRPVAGEGDLCQRARASFGAFGSSKSFEDYCRRMQQFMHSPVYRPDLDLVTVAPDGRYASFCILWIDPVNREGYFEPVGTHPDFQDQGLGKAVLTAGLQHLRHLGMTQASLCVEEENFKAVHLYEHLGFQKMNRLLTYEKKLN